MSKYHIIIFGAGPIGLSAAILFYKAGIRKEKILVCDPRAQNYTREGHIVRETYDAIRKKVNIHLPPKDLYHIKELERALHHTATQFGLQIVKKTFCGFTDNTLSTVKVSNENHDEEYLESDYILDCTGASRRVLTEVNHYFPDTFKPEVFAKSKSPNRLHAYIRMHPETLENIVDQRSVSWSKAQPLEYARNIAYLRNNFNWTFFNYPDFFGVHFGKNKANSYISLPTEIPENFDIDHWLKSVLHCYNEYLFEYLPPSRTYPHKKKISIFTLNFTVLFNSSFQKKGYPTVIGLGDTQITPLYTEGNGIRLGVLRIEELIKSLIIVNGQVLDVDLEEYQHRIAPSLQSQIKKIQTPHPTDYQFEPKDFIIAKMKFENAIRDTPLKKEKICFSNILEDINAHIEWHEALQLFNNLFTNKKLKISIVLQFLTFTYGTNSLEIFISQAETLARLLINSYKSKAIDSQEEKKQMLELLTIILQELKTFANKIFKQHTLAAISLYKISLSILQFFDDVSVKTNPLYELTLYSNLVLCYLRLEKYSEAIHFGKGGLERGKNLDSPEFKTISAKILFNFIKASYAQTQKLLPNESREISQQALQWVDHSPPLSESKLEQLTFMINHMKELLSVQNSSSSQFFTKISPPSSLTIPAVHDEMIRRT